MKKIHWLLGAVMAVVMSACGTKAYVQKDPSVDFSKIRTYSWARAEKDKGTAKPGRTNDLQANKIRAAMDRNLQAAGWRLTRGKPDVVLVYDLDIQRDVRNVADPVYSQPMTRWYYSPFRRTYLPIYYPSQFLGYNNMQQTVNEGTLTLTIMDADNEKTIWQGWTTSDLNGRRMTDKEIDDNVKAIIKKLG